MKCRRCGTEIEDNLLSCPNCGMRASSVSIENSVTKEINPKPQDEDVLENVEKNENTNDTAVLPFIFALIIIIGVFAFFYFNNNKDKEYEENTKDNLIKYKEEGYTFIDLYKNIDTLEPFNLVNTNGDFSLVNAISDEDVFCGKIKDKVVFMIVDGKVLVSVDDYKVEVKELSDIKSIIYYHKKQCECTDYNLAALSSDGNVYIYESDKLDYVDVKELVDDIASGFKKIETTKRIKSISATAYIGEINPCGEKILFMIDSDNNKIFYRNQEIKDSTAKYSLQMYNIMSTEDEKYSIYINPDRTMQIGKIYQDENKYIMDTSAKKIKYYGAFREENSKELQVLSTDGYLYLINLEDVENTTVSLVRNLKVNNIGYKFDLNVMKSKYVVMYSDGSTREYVGSFETHGIFSEK